MGFYMLSNKALNKYNGSKDSGVILVLWHCMRQENKARISGELPKGDFEFTVRYCMEDLKITKHQVTKAMDILINDNIISPVYLSKSKGKPSLYRIENVAFSSQYVNENSETVNQTVDETVDDYVGASDFNTSELKLKKKTNG